LYRFFKLYDPYRLFGLIFLLFALRIPVFFGYQAPAFFDLDAAYLGKLLDAGFLPYLDIRTEVGPISLLVYWAIAKLPFSVALSQQILATLLLAFQALIINRSIANYRMHKELTNYGALAYVLFALLLLGATALSPALIALSFLVLAIANLSELLIQKRGQDAFFATGFWLGLAILSEVSTVFYLLFFIWMAAAFSDANAKKLAILVIGAAFPVLLAVVTGLLMGLMPYMMHYWLVSLVDFSIFQELQVPELAMVLLPPAILMTYAWGFGQGIRGLNLNQQRYRNLFFSWLTLSVVFLFLWSRPIQNGMLIYLLPAASYYFAHYFLLGKIKWLKALVMLLIFLQIILVQILAIPEVSTRDFGRLIDVNFTEKSGLFALQPGHYAQQAGGKPVWIQSGAPQAYGYATSPGLFINDRIKEDELTSFDTYKGVERIFQAFEKQPPYLLIVEEAWMDRLRQRLPVIAERYQELEPGIYKEKD